jgi:alkylation response protein AidB-like acyl-CoA dehydrogenase
MDLTLTPEQAMLVQAARGHFTRSCTLADVRAVERDPRGFEPARWREFAALGWAGIELPSAYGGGGLGFLEVALLLEEMGRVLLPTPFLATVVLAAPLILTLGSEAERRRWLAATAAGECVATLALAEPGWRSLHGAPALGSDGAGRLTGRKTFVPYAADADLLLVAVTGASLVVVEHGAPGLEWERLATLAGEPLYAVRFADTPATRLGASGAAGPVLARVLDRGAIGTLAFMVGAAERTLEMTVAHARTRVQFGRPIGSFQAVAHRCVDMRSDIDALRYLVYQAAWALAAGSDVELAVATAHAYGGSALQRIFMHAHQVHGAIGFSTEHDLHLFTRRAKAAELVWGSGALGHERVACAMGL